MFILLALRNIARNKRNSFLLVLFIMAITFIFFIGNSFIEKTDTGLRAAYVESLTGDVVLEKTADLSMNLFGVNAPVIDSYFTMPVFPAYDAVKTLVSQENGIAGMSSQVSGRSLMKVLDVSEPVLLCGVDPETYFSIFPGIILEEGNLLRPGEYGAMITKERAQRIEQKTGHYPEIGTPVLLTSASDIGFKIREVPLAGIFSYRNPGQFMNEIVICDPQTVRALNSIQVASGTDVEISKDTLAILNADTDDLFGGPLAADQSTGEAGFSVESLKAFLGGPAAPVNETAGGDWNFIIIRLKDGWSPAAFISSINKKLAPYGITAVDWRTAAGTSAILLVLVKALFNGGMFLVGAAGVIAAINVLLISVFRRTREIGTLRTIGASDGYIRSLVFCENLIIALIAAFIGILGGLLFFKWINSMNIHLSNSLIVSLLGEPVLSFKFLPHIALFSFAAALVLGFAASVYPVEVAVRIEPMAAVRKG